MRRATSFIGFALVSLALSTACSSKSAATASHPGSGGSAGAGDSAGASGAAGAPDAAIPHCSDLDPRAVPLELAVMPDAGEAPYVDALSKAQASIDMMIYEMGPGGVLDTLTAKAKAGVKVRIIFDTSEKSYNQTYYDQLTAAGAQAEWSASQFTYMHAKYFVVDGSTVVISSGNYPKSEILAERNYAMTDSDPNDVADAAVLFEADWQRKSPDLSCTRLVVSPVNSRARILSLINSATRTLDIESLEFADSDVRSAVVARHTAGVAVRVLLATTSFISSNADAATYLEQNGITPRWLSSRIVHVKAIIVGGARAYAGSENLSYTSLNENREVGLAVTEAPAIASMQKTFNADWEAATSF
jgi:cardiolipin synthase A/B